jgi:energy-coupling factor transporter ATP-binding protein EcfA2
MANLLLSKIFLKPVDRDIEGVIKADGSTGLKTEVEEYVLTGEVERRLESFLAAYNNYASANGVWISGFFGSGKSHLLKMLALLLERRTIQDCDIVTQFMKKCEQTKNEVLAGEITKAVTIPSESILFNIDQKADVISKQQLDALVAVFVKVFDEHCGYYGKQPWIADFERRLDQDGHFQAFQQEFEKAAGRTWEHGRQRINQVTEEIDTAYRKVTKATKSGVIDAYRQDFRLSIEDFAEQVQQYISKKPKGFRLNFFVDEVGQYVAGTPKLMTNLQTIAESLATRCNGQAWILVTAQEDMNMVVGEMNKKEANDFTKIQARFKERMKLTSQDVSEVIQKRLLAKDPDTVKPLEKLYTEHSNNFGTMFDFIDGSQTYRNFEDCEHFVDCYPFIPYQFTLFQSSIRNLSEANAFEGKNSSVGERSMLGVFQDVARHLSKFEVGQLATFDLMFEGLRQALKSLLHSAITTAEKNLDNLLAVRLLKALFLVKYVREFKATPHNLTVLMLDRFDGNISDLRKRVQEALNLLETQTYIQRNGDLYEFLTNDEKDVETEIKNTDVETEVIAEALSKMLFDSALKGRQLRHSATGRDFTFTRKLDDRIAGREAELGIHFISPFHPHNDKLDQLKMESTGRREMLAVLPAEDRLYRDLLLLKKTEKYIKQNLATTQKESVRKILSDKQNTNAKRAGELETMVKELVGKARMFVNGSEFESNITDPVGRISAGFEVLIDTVHINLRMVSGSNFNEAQISSILTTTQDSLFETGVGAMLEAETELLGFVQREAQKGVRTTLKSVIEYFEKAPNGWPLVAIQCLLARLCARGKLEARKDSELLQQKPLAEAIKNSREHGNVILEPQVEYSASQVRQLKEFYSGFFNEPAPAGQAGETSGLGKKVAEKLAATATELQGLVAQKNVFPFLETVEEGRAKIAAIAKKPYQYFFTEFRQASEELQDLKESLLDPIRQFMSGSMRDIYSQAGQFLKDHQANLEHVSEVDVTELQSLLANPKCYVGNAMQSVKTRLTKLQKDVQETVEQQRQLAAAEVSDLRTRVESMPEFARLSPEQQLVTVKPFEARLHRIGEDVLIAVIRDSQRRFVEKTYPQILSDLTKPIGVIENETSKGGDAPVTAGPIVSAKSLAVNYSKPMITTAYEADDYAKAIKAAIIAEIDKGNRVQV